MNISVDSEYVIQSCVDMVRINSVNPSLSPEGKGEAEMGAYVADALNDLGLEVTTYKIAPNRVNVVGILRGKGNGNAKSLLLNAHMDTVGVNGMTIDPFGADVRNGRLYGRGSQDMKASLAAMMGAAKGLIDNGVELAGDLLITAVADEEYASIGTDDLVKNVTADAAIVTEPTDMHLCRAHRGFIWYEVETMGRAAHGSRFQEGIDANMRMGRFLGQLDMLEKALRQRLPHPLAGPPSLHASQIIGGTEISMYAAHCQLMMERRTVPGETVEQATAELQALIDHLSIADPTFKATLKPTFHREPFEINADAAIVQTVAQAIDNRLGKPPAHSGQTFWTDAAILADAGIETVLLGPIGYGLHSAEEWVDMQSMVDLTAILMQTAVSYCS